MGLCLPHLGWIEGCKTANEIGKYNGITIFSIIATIITIFVIWYFIIRKKGKNKKK